MSEQKSTVQGLRGERGAVLYMVALPSRFTELGGGEEQ